MRKSLPGIAALIAAAGLDLAGLFRTLVLFPSLPDILPGNGVGKPMLLYLPSLAILLWIALFLASLRARRLEMKLPLPSAALPEAREALAEFLRILSLVSAGGFFYAVLRLSGGKTISPLAYVLLLLGLFLAAGHQFPRCLLIRRAQISHRADHFRAGQITSLIVADAPEDMIRHAAHRRKPDLIHIALPWGIRRSGQVFPHRVTAVR